MVGELDLGQRRNRQQSMHEPASQRDGNRQERRGNRPAYERS
jgi:hypothetical protein